MFLILQSFTLYVFPTFLDNKKIINTDGTWYFYNNFSAQALFSPWFQ